jgi:hypothetical protein
LPFFFFAGFLADFFAAFFFLATVRPPNFMLSAVALFAAELGTALFERQTRRGTKPNRLVVSIIVRIASRFASSVLIFWRAAETFFQTRAARALTAIYARATAGCW